jgi:COP9 signalosome complex subunit 7
MIGALQNWAGRCQSTLGDLEEQIKSIRDAATIREKEKRASDKKLQALVDSVNDGEKGGMISSFQRDNLTRRAINKRSMADPTGAAAELMDIDELYAEDLAKRASKRKL